MVFAYTMIFSGNISNRDGIQIGSAEENALHKEQRPSVQESLFHIVTNMGISGLGVVCLPRFTSSYVFVLYSVVPGAMAAVESSPTSAWGVPESRQSKGLELDKGAGICSTQLLLEDWK